jgi:hypothetical protein
MLERLKELELPDVLTFGNGKIVDNKKMWPARRAEIIQILSSQVYGFSPPPPPKVDGILLECDNEAFAGKAVHSIIQLKFDTSKGGFSFPIHLIVPKNISPSPLFLHIAFRPDIPDKYFPVEEIIDGGFATASFCYEEVTLDRDDGFVSGLSAMYAGASRKGDEWGKISMWAWAAQRVMDYIQTLEEIDKEHIAVVGHSRLGKTALWCAAQDERFFMGISNNSGCSGAAITRGKRGERIKDITHRFGYWFCENYCKYIDNEHNMPFDQHFLLAAIAPRFVYVSSAQQDEWADPESEFLSCLAASGAYELFGLKGLVTEQLSPQLGVKLHQGHIGYHLRAGTHYLSRYDWQQFMEYMRVCRKRMIGKNSFYKTHKF